MLWKGRVFNVGRLIQVNLNGAYSLFGVLQPRQRTRGNLILNKDFYTMKKVISLLVAAFMLSSCAVYTPAGSVVVDPGGHGGGHCPPGQAKKGRC